MDSRLTPKKPGRPRDDARRDMLVRAALRLLQASPPADVSRLTIARAADVDPALIRYYFGDKYNLCAEVVEIIAREIVDTTTAALAIPGTPRQRLARFIVALQAVHARHPHYHQLILDQVSHGRKDAMLRMRSEMSASLRTTLMDLMREGAVAGEMRVVDPGLLGIAIIGMCEYYSSRWGPVATLLNGGTSRPVEGADETYAAFIAELVVHGLSPDIPPRG